MSADAPNQREDEELLDLLRRCEERAREGADGHLTIYRFTSGWKITLGTPQLYPKDHDEVANLRSSPTLAGALADFAATAIESESSVRPVKHTPGPDSMPTKVAGTSTVASSVMARFRATVAAQRAIEDAQASSDGPDNIPHTPMHVGEELETSERRSTTRPQVASSSRQVGHFTPFNPHDKVAWPEDPGIYVFYDVSERPIYVGQGVNIAKRIKEHEEKFWFKHPIVAAGAYAIVRDEGVRVEVETLLIRFLKRNAIINKHHVDRP